MKTAEITSIVLRYIIAIIFLQTLYFKFTAHQESVQIFTALGVEPFGRIGVGVVELITAILLILPRTKLYGILLSFGVILGALFSHILVLGISVQGDGGTLFYLALIILIASTILLLLHRKELLQVYQSSTKRWLLKR